MPWRIPSACCPRCRRVVHRDELRPAPRAWLVCDPDAAMLWPGGPDAIPSELRVCPDCRAGLRGLFDDACRWERELHATWRLFLPHRAG